MSYQIQRADRNGEWEDIFRASFDALNKAKSFATAWASKDPKCAWGVRVVNAEGVVVFEP